MRRRRSRGGGFANARCGGGGEGQIPETEPPWLGFGSAVSNGGIER